MATGCEQGVIAGGGVAAAAVDAPAKDSGCSRCGALQQQLEAQRWELVRERCAARSFRSLHERACARERARQEEVKALRADISGAAALRKEVETLKARLATLSGAERSSPDRLRMKHRALRSRVQELEGEVERLRSLNRQLQQATYGRRSERRCRSQRRGAAVTAPGEGRSRGQQPGAAGHGRTPRPALPVVEETLEAPMRRCPHCARPYAANGASVTQLIEVEVSAYVRRIHRPRTRARCRCAPASEAVAAPPARLFAHTAYGVSVWAWFVLECYAYHRPLRAVARALATVGIPIAPGTLADAQSRLLRVFEPVEGAIAERQRTASLVQGDETRWMIHVRGERGENPRCWLWLCLSEDAVRMHIDPTRSARAAWVLFAELGEKLPAILVCDRYGAYRKLARELAGRFVLATCWVHARRDFIGAAQRHPELQAWSERWLKRFAGLYTRNARCRAHFERTAATSAQPAAFHTAHRRLVRKVAERFETAKRELHGVPNDSPKAPALRALVREREGLTVFLDEPSTPMDNNASERALRAPAISRKVSFGSHRETGARLSAVLFSLFATLALAGINPHHWRLDYLHACAANAGSAPVRLDPWLPWAMDDARLERLRHPYPVQPHGP